MCMARRIFKFDHVFFRIFEKKNNADFRSPTLGISRSPISRAKKWTFPTLDPIVNVPIVQVSKEKEDLMSFSEEPIVAAAAAVHVVPVVAEEIAVPVMPAPIVMEAIPSVSNELEKLRIEFSVKHQDSPAVFSSPMARSAKQFLSSPALWKTISNSPMIDSPMPSSNHASDPLLQNWNSPSARRNLFTRQESASAA